LKRGLLEYAAEYLFKPLDIRYHWKLTPTGLPDTEGGLYLSSRDLAKIGYLFLKNGRWDGKQIVSVEWVKASVTPQVTTGEGSAQYGYMGCPWFWPTTLSNPSGLRMDYRRDRMGYFAVRPGSRERVA
jgi:CubicO group peptidase (beta-lactamase class C family)